MTDDFYRAFEEAHRGPREWILQRLAAYRPFIKPLTEIYAQRDALDLGCGRGEWLEFLQGEDFSPVGVDLDEGMLQACEERGLMASRGDALKSLAALDDESQVVVSAIHMVEHISFEQLRMLVSEAHRVLKPGGLLIMETPNPENITVATCNFYLDPTHVRPIPPALLSFLPTFYHYARTKVVRLQEPEALRNKASLTVGEVLAGASPDYAVVAQKTADPDVLCRFDEAFAQDYGLSTALLAYRYDAGIQESQRRVVSLDAELTEQYAAAQRVETSVQRLEASVQCLGLDVEASGHRMEQLFEELNAIHMSRSWRITAPLRWLSHQIRLLHILGVRARTRALAKKILRCVARYLDGSPKIKALLVSVAARMGLKSRLKALYVRVGGSGSVAGTPQDCSQLTPRGRDVYHALEVAVEDHEQGGSDAHRY